jgi:hypothetical protein
LCNKPEKKHEGINHPKYLRAVLISIDKKLISTEALANIIRLLELETMAQHINFSSELIALGNTIKQEWWQENKKRLLKAP